jgi:hypothetical protein
LKQTRKSANIRPYPRRNALPRLTGGKFLSAKEEMSQCSSNYQNA